MRDNVVCRLFAVAMSAMCTAQAPGVFVVDAAMGLGANFGSLQYAVGVVPSGSTLLVRPGVYGDVDLIAKSLTILCDPQVFVGTSGSTAPCLQVRYTWPYQTVVIRGLLPATSSSKKLMVDSCSGLVSLDGGGGMLGTLEVVGSSRVTVRDGSFSSSPLAGSARAFWAHANSYVALDSCTIVGANAVGVGGTYNPPGWAVVVGSTLGDATTVQLSSCVVRGGNGFWQFVGGPPGWPQYIGAAATPAVSLDSGALRVLGQATHTLVAGQTPAGSTYSQPPAILGGGAGAMARVDPAIPMLPTASLGVSLFRPAMPCLIATAGGLGGTTTITRTGSATLLSLIAVGMPGWTAPSLQQIDPLGLDAATAIIVTFGASASLVASLTIPNVPSLRGFAYACQAVDLGPNGTQALSNPIELVVP